MSWWKSIRELGFAAALPLAFAVVARTDAGPSPLPRTVDRVAPSNAYRGRVVDEHGAPVAGARVTLDRYYGEKPLFGPFDFDPTTQLHAVSDAQGRYVFEDVEPCLASTLIVAHPDHAEFVELAVPIGATGVFEQPDARLERGVTLVGFVRDERGAPVVGAIVALPASELGRCLPWASFVPRTTTDALGAFVLDHLPTGWSRVELRPEGRGTVRRGFACPANGASVAHEFRLLPPMRLGGIVLDDAGNLLAGVEVRAAPLELDAAGYVSTRTNACGEFRFESLSGGGWTVGTRGLRQDVELRGGLELDSEHVELRVPGFDTTAVRTVRGTVLHGDSATPVEAFEVLRHHNGYTGRLPTEPGEPLQRNDARAGRFQVEFPVRNDEFEWMSLEFRAPGLAPAFLRPAEFGPAGFGTKSARVEAVVRMTKGGTLRGRVLDEHGAPLPGARIHAREADWETDDPIRIGSIVEIPTRATRRDARSSTDGSFELAVLSPDDYRLVVEAPGFALLTRECGVAEGRTTELAELRLVRGTTIRGRVVCPEGAPQRRVLVRAQPLEGAFARSFVARALPSGRFEFTGLENVPHRVSAAALASGDPFAEIGQRSRSGRDVSLAPGGVLDDLVLVLDER